ncbi:MAG: serine hydrolase [Chitinophagaceae bacterium]
MKMFFFRFCLFLTICGLSNIVAGQERPLLYDSISKLVKKAFNTKDPIKIYALTSTGYQEKMSTEKFSEGMKKFYLKTGKWNNLLFKEETDGGMAYTAGFERESQVLFLQLDEQGKIVRFNFKPVPFVKGTKSNLVPSNNPLASEMDSLMEKLIRPYIQQGHTVGLCIAIISNNKVHHYSYGEVVKGSNKLPDPQNTIFEIGSVTKTFTSLLLANEVTRKQMSLKDPINKYLPEFIPKQAYKNTAITLVHLANHTSGFPRLPANIFQGDVNPQDPYRHYNADSVYHFLSIHKPNIIPGSQFSYSNFGAGLLGNILSRKSHKTFEELLTGKIFEPLKMHSTKIKLNAKDNIQFAQGYNEKGEPTMPWDLAALQGSGAIRSTLNDMIRYVKAQLGLLNTPLDKAILLTHQVTFQSKENTIGLGWRIEKQKNHVYWHHSGGTGGFRSFVGFDKKHLFGVVILSNTAEDVTTIGQSILESN